MPNFEECDKCGERCDGAERLRVCADCDRDLKRLGWFDSASTQVARREAYDKGRSEGYAEAVADVVAWLMSDAHSYANLVSRLSAWAERLPPIVSALRLAAAQIRDGAHVGAAKKGTTP
jgi:hypothetical protein